MVGAALAVGPIAIRIALEGGQTGTARRDQCATAKHLEESAARGDAKKALRQFISAFGEHASGDRARQMLVERLTGADTLLERERLLRRLERSSDEAVSIGAAVQLAKLLEQAEHPEAALVEYRRLQTEFGDKPVIGGKSVREMLNGLPADSPLAKAMWPRTRWREGKIEGSLVDGAAGRLARRNLRPGAINIDLRGNPGPFFRDVALGYDSSRQEIFGRDASGQMERFAIRVEGQNPNQNPFGINQYADNFAFAQGHLLVVFAGYRLVALDTLIPASVSGDRVCWQKELCDPSQIGELPSHKSIRLGDRVRRISALLASGQ